MQPLSRVLRFAAFALPCSTSAAKARRPPGMVEGTTPWTWEVESCREQKPRAASGDPHGCGEVEQRREQLPKQRPRVMQAATNSCPHAAFAHLCTSEQLPGWTRATPAVPLHLCIYGTVISFTSDGLGRISWFYGFFFCPLGDAEGNL